MIQNVTLYVKLFMQHGIEFLAITGIQFVLFLLYTKYKTGKSFTQIFSLYTQLFIRVLLFTLTFLSIIVVLTKYVSYCSIIVVLLAISSLSIVLKYFAMVKKDKGFIFDMSTLLANGFVMYAVITDDTLSFPHYLVAYAITLYMFLYKDLHTLYKED